MEPENLQDVFIWLQDKIVPKDLTEWKDMPEDKATASVHHTLGRSLRNNLGLWKGDTPITKYMKKLGLSHADDMSGLILHCFHRHLNNKPLEIEKEVTRYKDYWKNVELKE